ncbi:MAG: 2,3-bisphosphoglycerate-independent phosphoglycerate mutase [Myxococcales bacterium]|nr:2,3-bisphosphoglycerate-independent phosphoglycerate mutase [Myxococcales bacterium]
MTDPSSSTPVTTARGPLVIAIMDGVGIGRKDEGDAVFQADTPHLDALWQQPGTRHLRAHGQAVGLPSDGDMGNSEVGHNALGAGRVVRQGAALVNDAFASGALFSGDCWQWLTADLAQSGATLHLCGLLSDGNVHAHIDHVFALIDGAAAAGVHRVRIHALADGRDVADPSYERYLTALDAHLAPHVAAGLDYRLASGGGRMVVTMDRYEADWSIVERGWRAHVRGLAPRYPSWQAALTALRKQSGGQSDQTVGPFCIGDEFGLANGSVRDGDSFILWNFRGDRAIELSRAFEEKSEFSGFERGPLAKVRFAGMMQYDGDLHLPRRFLVAPPTIDKTLSEYVLAAGLHSLAVSETQKFGHVTYFWNGNRSEPLHPTLDEWIEIPSDRVSFDQAPAMKAAEITDVVLAALSRDTPPDIIRLNWANGDMVGHTGDFAATRVAMETVDREVGRLVAAVQAAGGVLLLTADHGNADGMWMRAKDGTPTIGPDGVPQAKTSHTLAPVPFSLVDGRAAQRWQLRQDQPEAGLSNVAATALAVLGLPVPPHMDAPLVEPSEG